MFTARVGFPVGMSEQRLRAELRRQGFELLAGQFPGDVNVATFYRNELISRTIWSIRWRATGGRVVEIWGVYGVQAP